MTRRAIFLDRDGVINWNRADHVKSWAEFEFLPRAREGLRQIARLDLAVVVVSNQAAINRRLVKESAVRSIHARMLEEIGQAGGRIDRVYFCPHTPEEQCGCRKPEPGMYLQAADDLDIDLLRSYIVGDAKADVQAAYEIGATPILVMTGRDCAQRIDAQRGCEQCGVNCVVVDDLQAAADWICAEENARR